MPLEIVQDVAPGILSYIPMTLLYWAVPTVLAAVLGTALCIIRVGRKRVLYWFVTVFISFFRGTPGIVQIYLVYFGLPKLFWFFGLDIQDWPAGVFFIIATTLNFSCFVAEALRSGYMAVDRGQIEAGLSIGLSRSQNFFRVIAPQTLRTSLLNIKNLEIDLIKDTSIAYTIGAVEIMGYANRMVSLHSGVGQLWILGFAAVVYFVFTALLEAGFRLAQRRMDRREVAVA